MATAVAIPLLIASTSVLAQGLRDCDPRMMCRATYHFGNLTSDSLRLGCGDDTAAVDGIVFGIQRKDGKCTRIVVQVGGGIDLPERILIDTASCIFWNGRIGDALRGFVRRDPSNQTRFDAVAYCNR